MQHADSSLWCLLLLRSTGSRVSGFSSFGSRALEHRPGSVVLSLSCSEACGIFPGQGSNPCLLHWQMGSAPLSHQGSPQNYFQITVSFHPHSHIRQVREDIHILASQGDGLSLCSEVFCLETVLIAQTVVVEQLSFQSRFLHHSSVPWRLLLAPRSPP